MRGRWRCCGGLGGVNRRLELRAVLIRGRKIAKAS